MTIDFYRVLHRNATADLSKSWVLEARKDGRICPGCHYVRTDPPLGPVEMLHLPTSPKSFCSAGLLRVAYHRDLVDLLIEHSETEPTISEIWDRGKLVKNYVVPWFGPDVAVRGSADSTFRVCATCGRIASYAAPPRYVLSDSFGTREVFSANSGVIVVGDRVRELIRAQFSGLTFERISVRDEPVDCFGALDYHAVYSELPPRSEPKPHFGTTHRPIFLLGEDWAFAETSEKWLSKAHRDGLVCPKCQYVDTHRSLGTVDVEDIPRNLSCINAVGMRRELFSVELVSLLAEFSTTIPILNAVEIVGAKEVIASHVAAWFGPTVPVRGSAKSELRRCRECGRLSELAEDPVYLLSGEIGGREVVSTSCGSVAVSERVGEVLRNRGFSHLRFERVEVIDDPIDGYGELDFDKRYSRLPRRRLKQEG